jgi:type I site-specific restriction-modification system R (restriction) subunit
VQEGGATVAADRILGEVLVGLDGSEPVEKLAKQRGKPGEPTRATSAKHLRTLLTEDHRYVFTLIQKFRTERGEKHPVLSDRDDVIVITDEAHRTQYDTLALNMRNALPNAGSSVSRGRR